MSFNLFERFCHSISRRDELGERISHLHIAESKIPSERTSLPKIAYSRMDKEENQVFDW